MTINDFRNDSNRATTSDVQVQFVDNSEGISHQNLLRERMIDIRNEEVPVLVSPTEMNMIANNQPAMTVSTGVIQAPQALKTHSMKEFIMVTTLYNMVEIRTH